MINKFTYTGDWGECIHWHAAHALAGPFLIIYRANNLPHSEWTL
jgi:hypothetical protein